MTPGLVVSPVDRLLGLGAAARARSASASTHAAADLDAAFRATPSSAGRSALDALVLDLAPRHPVVAKR